MEEYCFPVFTAKVFVARDVGVPRLRVTTKTLQS